MPTRLNDLFVYALLIGVLILAFLGINGCASSVPPTAAKAIADVDRVPYQATIKLVMPDGVCSGVAIDVHHFLTAAHCVQSVGPFRIIAFPGVDSTAELLLEYQDVDVALMRTPMKLTAIAALAPEPPSAGELLIFAGFGCLKDSLFVTSGVFLGAATHTNGYLTSAAVCLGDSGGPVFNRKGEVVGLTSARSTELPVAVVAPTQGL